MDKSKKLGPPQALPLIVHFAILLEALYVSEGWHVLWKEHGKIKFKASSLVSFDRAMRNHSDGQVAFLCAQGGAA